MNVAESEKPGSVGEFGWAGAAKTYYWVDPQEKIIGILMSQSLMQFEKPEADFQVLGLSSVHRLVYGVISVSYTHLRAHET